MSRPSWIGPIAAVSRRLQVIDGLNPWLRPLRPLRTAVRIALLRLHQPTRPADAVRAVVGVGDGLRLGVDTLDLVDRELYLVGFEPEINGLLRRLVERGTSAIDVGANIGVHTVAMARAAAPGRVLACEPNPRMVARLRENVARNRLANVEVRAVAVTDHEGEVLLHVPRDPQHVAGASLGRGIHEHLLAASEIGVRGVTLDRLAEEAHLGKVSLVKVDVEGMEPAVLRGALGLLRRDRPALIFEYTPDWWSKLGFSLRDVVDQLSAAGYDRPSWISWRGLREVPLDRRAAMNLLALPRGFRGGRWG